MKNAKGPANIKELAKEIKGIYEAKLNLKKRFDVEAKGDFKELADSLNLLFDRPGVDF